MADFVVANKNQSLAEIRQWDVNFSADCPTGVTVVSATATHTPPSGAAAVPTVGVISANIVPVTLGPLSVKGTHFLNVLATLSDGEKSEMKIEIGVIF